MCPQESSNVSLSVNPRRVIPPLQPRPLHSQPLIRLPLMFQASHFEPRRFAQRDEAAHSRERSFQRRSSMRHVTIILNNLPTEEYKVDSYVNAYPLFSRPIPPLPLLPFAIRPPSFSSVPRVFDRLYLSLSLSFPFLSPSTSLLKFRFFTRPPPVFRRFIFTRFSFVSSMVTLHLVFTFYVYLYYCVAACFIFLPFQFFCSRLLLRGFFFMIRFLSRFVCVSPCHFYV